jgi:hypothetical protein
MTSDKLFLAVLKSRFRQSDSVCIKADRLEIHWPGRPVEVIENIEAHRILTVREGEGVVRSVPFGFKQ